MSRKVEVEVKVGIFIGVGLLLLMVAILFLGGANSIFIRYNYYSTHFKNAQGIVVGSKVELNGIRVGTVDKITFNHKQNDIEITLAIEDRFKDLIRENSVTDQPSQGVLGDKYLSITMGDPSLPPIAPGGEIPAAKSKGLQDFLQDGGSLIATLNRIANSFERTLENLEEGGRSKRFFEGMAKTATNFAEMSSKLNKQVDQLELQEAVKNLNSILKKINNGTGTLGAFVNDPSLYDDAKSLISGVNRNRIMRNLIRQTVKENNDASHIKK